MSNQSSLLARLGDALATPTQGVVGLVDELLAASCEQDLQLGWHEGHCRVSILNGGPPDRIEVPVPKSVFRAVLARVAALCNEQIPNSVSPYGGHGELAVESDSTTVIRMTFLNTPEEQSLALSPVKLEGIQESGVPEPDSRQAIRA